MTQDHDLSVAEDAAMDRNIDVLNDERAPAGRRVFVNHLEMFGMPGAYPAVSLPADCRKKS